MAKTFFLIQSYPLFWDQFLMNRFSYYLIHDINWLLSLSLTSSSTSNCNTFPQFLFHFAIESDLTMSLTCYSLCNQARQIMVGVQSIFVWSEKEIILDAMGRWITFELLPTAKIFSFLKSFQNKLTLLFNKNRNFLK